MGWEIIALKAVAENIILRVARLADRSQGIRSVKNLLKKVDSKQYFRAETLAQSFHEAAEEAVKIRHEKLAHMKTGDLSGYPLEPLPHSILRAIGALLDLMDHLYGKEIVYLFSPGSQEANIDLSASLRRGETVTV